MKKFLSILPSHDTHFSLKKYYVLTYFLGSGLIAAITIPFGPAVGGDSIDYLSTAANLAIGKGFVNYAGHMYVTWPPLYPIILAVASNLTGLSTYTAGWIINSMLFGVFLIAAGRLFQLSLPSNPIWSILASLTLLLSFSSIAIFSSIAADPIFILLVLLFLIRIQVFINNLSVPSMTYLGFIAAFASLQRWNGAVLIVLGVIVIFHTLRHNIKKAILFSTGFSLISVLPVSIWLLTRDYLLIGTLLGRGGSPFRGNLMQNSVKYIYPRLVHWFLPISITNSIPQIVVVIGVVLILLVLANKLGFKNIVIEFTNQKLFPLILFILLYLPFIALTTILADHPNIFDDRHLVPILVPLLVLLYWVIDKLVNILTPKRAKNYVYFLVVAGFLLWSIYPINIIRKMVIQSFARGPSISNEFNVDIWRDSKTIAFAQNYNFNPDYSIASNYPSPLYLYTGKTVIRSPLDDDNHPAIIENFDSSIAAWEGTSNSYLVWFLPNCCKDHYDPQQLSSKFIMTLLYTSEDGMIFLMESFNQSINP